MAKFRLDPDAKPFADDLRDRIAALGICTVRYPVLWERVAPDGVANADWSWTARLSELQKLGVEPIAGLCHHGSGPRYTDLLDPEFPDKLANYARMVAEKFRTKHREIFVTPQEFKDFIPSLIWLPFGTRKAMPVYIEESILALPRIVLNGGRRGYLVGIDPQVVVQLLGAKPVQCALAE